MLPNKNKPVKQVEIGLPIQCSKCYEQSGVGIPQTVLVEGIGIWCIDKLDSTAAGALPPSLLTNTPCPRGGNHTYTSPGAVVSIWNAKVVSTIPLDLALVMRCEVLFIDNQTEGAAGNHTDGRVRFTLFTTEDRDYKNGRQYDAVIRHPHGEKPSKNNDSLEAEVPEELRGVVHNEDFRICIDRYFYAALGWNGSFAGEAFKVPEELIRSSRVTNSGVFLQTFFGIRKSQAGLTNKAW